MSISTTEYHDRQYLATVEEIRSVVKNRPSEATVQTADLMRKAITENRANRVLDEANHLATLQRIREFYNIEQSTIRGSMKSLEEQLANYQRMLEESLAKQAEEEKLEKDHFVAEDDHRKRLLRGQEAMLDALLS